MLANLPQIDRLGRFFDLPRFGLFTDVFSCLFKYGYTYWFNRACQNKFYPSRVTWGKKMLKQLQLCALKTTIMNTPVFLTLVIFLTGLYTFDIPFIYLFPLFDIHGIYIRAAFGMPFIYLLYAFYPHCSRIIAAFQPLLSYSSDDYSRMIKCVGDHPYSSDDRTRMMECNSDS
jgi:hypothetical protein